MASTSDTVKAAYVAGFFAVVVALIGLAGYWLDDDNDEKADADDGPPQPVLVSVEEDGTRVASNFTLSFTAGGKVRRASGVNGTTSISVPNGARGLEQVSVSIPCYEQVTDGDLRIAEDASRLTIRVRRRAQPEFPPLSPNAYPSFDSIPLEDRPSPEEIAASTSADPASHVLEYSNETGADGRLLLFSHSRHAAGDPSPWRVLPADPCNAPQRFSRFGEPGGWFSVFYKPEGGNAAYRTTFDLYKQEATELRVARRGEGYEAAAR